jgi:hypothetical protein
MDNSVNKATLSLITVMTLVLAVIVAKARALVDAQAPVGYEDESGFHLGSPDFKE